MAKSTHTVEYARLREKLIATRLGAKLTQRALAKRLRVPHSWVAKIESGERRIDLVEFGWVCAACGVSASDAAASFFRDATVRRPKRGSRR